MPEVSEKVKAAMAGSAMNIPAAITLPTAYETKRRDSFPFAATTLIISHPKVGKSTFIEHVSKIYEQLLGKPLLHLDTENGCQEISGCVQPVRNLDEHVRVLALLEANHQAYSGFAVDTGDMLNEWCEAKACVDLGIKQMGQGSYGADWARARSYFMEYAMRLKTLGKALFFICHTKVDKSSKETGQIRPNLPSGLSEALMGQCDSIIYLLNRKVKLATSPGQKPQDSYERVISLAGHEGLCAGSRFKLLDGRQIAMPDLRVNPEANVFAPILDVYSNNKEQ